MGIDPLVENEDGEDIMSIVKQQYNFLGSELKKIQEFIVESSIRVIPPTELDAQAKLETNILDNYDSLVKFIDALVESLHKRVENIERDRLLLRAYALKKEVSKGIFSQLISQKISVYFLKIPPEFTVWNANQLDKAKLYITVLDLWISN